VIQGLQEGLAAYPELCKATVTEIPTGVTFIDPATDGKAN
jgi:hypothetical protein